MAKVEIVQLGPPLQDLNLKSVARTASRVQKHFQCVVGDPIPNIGPPNSHGEYKVAGLLTYLEQRRQISGAETQIGVIDGPVHDGYFSVVDAAANNIGVSITPIEPLLSKLNKSK